MPESRVEHHLLTKIAEGANAEVYAYQSDRIIKLFTEHIPNATIEAEWRHAMLAHSLGIPTPRAFGMVRVGQRLGIAFERCDGPTLLDVAIAEPGKTVAVVDTFFSMQRRIHRCDASGLAPAKDSLERKIRAARGVNREGKEQARAELSALPGGSTLCHGDFHPRNVISTLHGPRVLDWMDAGAGDPALDVARSLLLIDYAAPSTVDTNVRGVFRDRYLGNWQREWPDLAGRLLPWRYPLAVARLSETVDEAEAALLREYVGSATTTRA
jgi:uncharacterized protein (TIGR02172 family)